MRLETLNFKIDSTCDPNNISPKFMHELADILYVPIAKLFQRSLASNTIPDIWIKANIIPVYKKKERL